MKIEDVSVFACIYTYMIYWTINASQVTKCQLDLDIHETEELAYTNY